MIKNWIRKIVKNWCSVRIKNYINKYEKVWKNNEYEIKYLFHSCPDSNLLIVVFSGFAGHHVEAKYNYVRTLEKIQANKLFILDRYGYENVGSYYLGDKCSLYQNGIIEKFINSIINELGIKRVVFSGSSKGGSAALLYGLKMHVSDIICGSPQFYLGDYLNLNDYHKCIYESIATNTLYDQEWFNHLISDYIISCNKTINIFLLYSIKEESYNNDIKYLISELERNDVINLSLKEMEYENHSVTGKYFAPYFIQVIQDIISSEIH